MCLCTHKIFQIWSVKNDFAFLQKGKKTAELVFIFSIVRKILSLNKRARAVVQCVKPRAKKSEVGRF